MLGSLVVTAPPSPIAMAFTGWKENTLRSQKRVGADVR